MPATPAEFTARMQQASVEVQAATRSAVAAAALAVTKAARSNIAAASGGDMRLSHVGKSGARVGAKYTIRDVAGGDASAIVTAEGPLQLIERDTKPHTEIPHGVGRVQGRRTKAARHEAKQALYEALFGEGGFSGVPPMSTPYGPRYRVEHPGTKGKHPFERAVNATAPGTSQIFASELERALRSVFR